LEFDPENFEPENIQDIKREGKVFVSKERAEFIKTAKRYGSLREFYKQFKGYLTAIKTENNVLKSRIERLDKTYGPL